MPGLPTSVYEEAERARCLKLQVNLKQSGSEISEEFNKVRQQLRGDLDNVQGVNDLVSRLSKLELENTDLKTRLQSLESRLGQLERPGSTPAPAAAKSTAAPASVPAKPAAADDDDDVDLFADDDEEENAEAERIKAERIAAYDAKKSKKPVLIAKSSITMDVKPWDDETDLKKLEESVRSIEMDGLVWGSSKCVPIAYGVKKLQIICVVEDDKVSTEELDERICAFEDYVQSVDIVAFNKI